jgi:hypothetical protein
VGRRPAGLVQVLALHVSADRVVPGERPGAVGAGDPDALASIRGISFGRNMYTWMDKNSITSS